MEHLESLDIAPEDLGAVTALLLVFGSCADPAQCPPMEGLSSRLDFASLVAADNEIMQLARTFTLLAKIGQLFSAQNIAENLNSGSSHHCVYL